MVSIKTPEQIALMRKAGTILSLVFEEIAAAIKIGVSASYLDDLAFKTIKKLGGEPGFLGYSGYKYTTCISKNEEIVHGIPYPDKILYPGDIFSIDCGVIYNGYFADAARTFLMEPVDPEIEKLVKVTEESFFIGIEKAIPGNYLGDISNAIQAHVEANHLTVVKDLYSHGIGTELHEDPLIPNYGEAGKGLKLKAGMTFAIEPMVNIGSEEILTCDDKWTIITADRKWSAHYENTIAILENGPEILTIS
ncbi:type I methionyl aminopeptidase [bacterium]|jgi:methionyl aminopeptidase|nr:type I methionyl aminopeptidase [bacterium]